MSDTTFMKMNADRYIRLALEEDITSEDISTNCVMPEYQKGQVDLICKQDGVICGLWVFQRVFELLDDTVAFDMKVKEGDFVHAGDLMAVVTGDIRALLSGERTALNYLQRMSGIATYTHEIAKLLEGSSTTLLDTRKTTPNMRLFEKYAVKAGGGSNHRYNLSDGVMLKDNHIGAAGSITKAVRMAKAYAYLNGRDFVMPEDVAAIFPDVCAHRLMLNSKARMMEEKPESVLAEILKTTDMPVLKK